MIHYDDLNNSLKNRLKQYVPNSLRKLFHSRRFHAFSIGTPKSGTTSVAGLLDKNFRASHEPERVQLIHLINDHYNKKVSDEQYVNWLQLRDRRVWLELESNCFLGYRYDLLLRAFPNVKYVLSVRDPISWLDSMMNHTINYPPKSEEVIKYWHGIFFRPEQFPHSNHDNILSEHSVYSVEAYLNYWAHSVSSALDTIPPKQLLVINTKQLINNKHKLAQFLGFSDDLIDDQSGHLNKAPNKYHLLDKIDKAYVEEVYQKYCAGVVNKLDKFA
ncbi:MAG: hypothetical protein OQK51_20715 [Kangiellaceae bacterium]|nr:hypothetical protein [Kangiellaceae bacterium]